MATDEVPMLEDMTAEDWAVFDAAFGAPNDPTELDTDYDLDQSSSNASSSDSNRQSAGGLIDVLRADEPAAGHSRYPSWSSAFSGLITSLDAKGSGISLGLSDCCQFDIPEMTSTADTAVCNKPSSHPIDLNQKASQGQLHTTSPPLQVSTNLRILPAEPPPAIDPVISESRSFPSGVVSLQSVEANQPQDNTDLAAVPQRHLPLLQQDWHETDICQPLDLDYRGLRSEASTLEDASVVNQQPNWAGLYMDPGPIVAPPYPGPRVVPPPNFCDQSYLSPQFGNMEPSADAPTYNDPRMLSINQLRVSTAGPIAVHQPEVDMNPGPSAPPPKRKGRESHLNEAVTRNPRYTPNPAYTPLPSPPESWSIFAYTLSGELSPSTLYTPSEISHYLLSHPHPHSLQLRIHRNPPASRHRYPTLVSHRCRFSTCPTPNNTINQGHCCVAFDELSSTRGEDHDPFLNAAYVHLYCLERFTDFPLLCSQLNIGADKRCLPKEANGVNPMCLGTRAEEALVEKFILSCRTGTLDASYPVSNRPGWVHEGTLAHGLAKIKLRKESRSVAMQRVVRTEVAGYQGSTLSEHVGDLEKEAGLRGKSRMHRFQRQRLERPKQKRAFRCRHDVSFDGDVGAEAVLKEEDLVRLPGVGQSTATARKRGRDDDDEEMGFGARATKASKNTVSAQLGHSSWRYDEEESFPLRGGIDEEENGDEETELEAMAVKKLELEIQLVEMKVRNARKERGKCRRGV